MIQDPIKAAEWLMLAAEQGNAEAHFNLSFCYENGEGLSVNLDEALRCYFWASTGGYNKAEDNLRSLFVRP